MAGTAKGYGLPFDYVLYEMSYVNCVMYSAVIPTYSSKKKGKGKAGKKEEEEVLNADDPKNNERIRKFLDSI